MVEIALSTKAGVHQILMKQRVNNLEKASKYISMCKLVFRYDLLFFFRLLLVAVDDDGVDSRGTLSVLLDLLKGPLSVSGTGDLTMTSCSADVAKVFFLL